MARRKDSPQKAAMREMMRNYLKNNDISIKDGTDVNSIMRDMMSVILEGALDEELDEELGYSKYDYRNKETDNSRNGHSSKTMHTSYGDMDVAIPRDRNGDYEPQLIKKYQNSVTQDMEEKILSMYAKGMTTGDIESHMRELYDIDISDSTISRITDKILPIVKEWQERPLEEVYAVVFMDAIHYHVRSEGRIVKRAVGIHGKYFFFHVLSYGILIFFNQLWFVITVTIPWDRHIHISIFHPDGIRLFVGYIDDIGLIMIHRLFAGAA